MTSALEYSFYDATSIKKQNGGIAKKKENLDLAQRSIFIGSSCFLIRLNNRNNRRFSQDENDAYSLAYL